MKEEAQFYRRSNGTVKCQLCPHRCVIKPGSRGLCGIRKNKEGKLMALTYGNPCTMHVDPIEKKPLYHVHPGSSQFSIATVGCNLSCKFCQNWRISQVRAKETEGKVPPEEVVENAQENDCEGIAYTYTEPTVFFEYAYDIAKLAKEAGLSNYFITNGYIEEKPLKKIAPYLDAANIDLKSFDPEFYKKLTGARLEPVKKAIKLYYENDVWIELTNLIIPGYNDDPDFIRKMARWMVKELDPDVPLHISRFFPAYEMEDVEPTPLQILKEAYNIAKNEGLNFVYIGNARLPEASNTYCPNCGELVIKRDGLNLVSNNLKGNKCPNCQEKIPGLF